MTEAEQIASNRLKGFGLHLLIYIVLMAILVPLNLFVFSQVIWFPFPMVGWGSLLAIHVAFVLGLFNR